MADEVFAPVFLRNATAYGASPRMRFDIVLNNLSGIAWTTKQIKMTSDGTPWRPLVHVLDICHAIECCLSAPADLISKQIFNVGHDADNYQVREIAKIVGDVFPGCEVSIGSSAGDNRSYRVSFAKIKNELPGFSCSWDAHKGALQLRRVFERVDLSKDILEGRGHTRLKMLKHLIATRQIDDEFYWRTD
jgi:nucleoside-diphosphate-sugar epimerase